MYIRHVETLIAKSMEGIPKIWVRDTSGRAGTGTIGQLYMHVAISLLYTSMVSSANKSIQPQDSLIYGEQSLLSTCCSTGNQLQSTPIRQVTSLLSLALGGKKEGKSSQSASSNRG